MLFFNHVGEGNPGPMENQFPECEVSLCSGGSRDSAGSDSQAAPKPLLRAPGQLGSVTGLPWASIVMLGSLLSSECAAAPPSAPCTTNARRRTHSQISKILKGKTNSPKKLSTLGHKQVRGMFRLGHGHEGGCVMG